MTDRETLVGLRAKVAALSGPDREVDGSIALALGLAPAGSFRLQVIGDGGDFGTGPYDIWKSPSYTASIDAAVALIERLLPVWRGLLDIGDWAPSGGYMARLEGADGHASAEGATPALALLLALLDALIERAQP